MTSNVTTNDLLSTMDARVWAKEFTRIACEIVDNPTQGRTLDPHSDDFESWMLSWFANAIMRGWDEAHHRIATAEPVTNPQ